VIAIKRSNVSGLGEGAVGIWPKAGGGIACKWGIAAEPAEFSRAPQRSPGARELVEDEPAWACYEAHQS
jgi:hypothetical protein